MTSHHLQLHELLDEVLKALVLQASEAQRNSLVQLVLLLHRWNSTYNLTAVRDPSAMMVQHIADCLAVIEPLDRRLASCATAELLDVGSGAGFPGSVIAVMRPDVHVTCIDSVGKKAAFVRQTAGALGLPNLLAEHGRVQDLHAGLFDVITSRALSELSTFVRMTSHLLSARGCWLAMKGKAPDAETGALSALQLQFHVEPLKVPLLNAERCLVWMNR